VLEVGASPYHRCLLEMDALRGATERIGIGLEEPVERSGYTIIQGSANDMAQFEDNRFEAVLCNATLEHDPRFWEAIGEMKRVCQPGGLLVIGVPGYSRYGIEKLTRPLFAGIPLIRKVPWLRRLGFWTLTIGLHDSPGDYYRFSPQAVREVFFEGMLEVQVTRIMVPPQLIGSGIVP
jgi:SAM-dependent methyltransferase